MLTSTSTAPERLERLLRQPRAGAAARPGRRSARPDRSPARPRPRPAAPRRARPAPRARRRRSSARAVAAPIPRLAPVTSAVRPDRLNGPLTPGRPARPRRVALTPARARPASSRPPRRRPRRASPPRRARCRAPRRAADPGVVLERVGDEPERPDDARDLEVLARVADRGAVARVEPAHALVRGDRRGLRDARRGAGGRRAPRAGRRAPASGAARRRCRSGAACRGRLGASSASASSTSTSPRSRCETSRPVCHGTCSSSRPGVVLEQQRGRARARRSARGSSARRGPRARQPVRLAVEHDPGAGLEDAARWPSSRASSIATIRRRPAHHDDLDVGAQAGLDRAHPEQVTPPPAAAQQPAARAEQRPVHVEIQTAHRADSYAGSGRAGRSSIGRDGRHCARIEPWTTLLDGGARRRAARARGLRGRARAGLRRRCPPDLHPAAARRARTAPASSALYAHQAAGARERLGGRRRSSRPAPRRASRCASSCRRSRRCSATRAPARSTSTRRRRWPRTRRARCTPSACTSRSARRSTTATRRARTAPRSAGARTSILTNPDMLHVGMLPNHARVGRLASRTSRSSSSTRRTSTAASSARTSPTCCAACGGSPRAYGTTPRFLLASATIANPVELAERLTGLDDVRADRRGRLAGRAAPDRDVEPAARGRGAADAAQRARARRPRSSRELVARGRAHDLLHEVAQGRRARRQARARRAGARRRARARRPRRRLPRRLHAAAAPRARGQAHRAASCSPSSRPTRWSSGSTSARSTPPSA